MGTRRSCGQSKDAYLQRVPLQDASALVTRETTNMDAVGANVASAGNPGRAMGRRGERVLLEGPHSRLKELRLVLRVAWEFIAGFRTLHFVGPCVTVFGSARFGESHPYYALGREVGRGLARLGFTVMTGGARVDGGGESRCT